MFPGNTADVAVETFNDDGTFPNSRLPLLLYRAAVPSGRASPEAMEALFDAAGWPPAWRYTVYPFHHYHSNAHEALGVGRGSARLMLGGPSGREFDVTTGDVVLIPAGVVHKRLAASGDFLMVGAYPPGPSPDLLRGEPGDRPGADHNITSVPLPRTDPVAGADGPLQRHWR